MCGGGHPLLSKNIKNEEYEFTISSPDHRPAGNRRKSGQAAGRHGNISECGGTGRCGRAGACHRTVPCPLCRLIRVLDDENGTAGHGRDETAPHHRHLHVHLLVLVDLFRPAGARQRAGIRHQSDGTRQEQGSRGFRVESGAEAERIPRPIESRSGFHLDGQADSRNRRGCQLVGQAHLQRGELGQHHQQLCATGGGGHGNQNQRMDQRCHPLCRRTGVPDVLLRHPCGTADIHGHHDDILPHHVRTFISTALELGLEPVDVEIPFPLVMGFRDLYVHVLR